MSCGGIAPCTGAFTSDIIAGLERVYALAPALNVVSVNMSLGGSVFSTPCDESAVQADHRQPAIDRRRHRRRGRATTASTFGISTPACISSAVSVGSTDKTNARLVVFERRVVPVAASRRAKRSPRRFPAAAFRR